MKEIVGLMLVKSGSKRLPNKNVLIFNGKPMFLWNLEKLLDVVEKVFVSSDSDDILMLAVNHGALAIKRPDKLCGDTPNIPVYQHALKKMGRKVGAFIAVQANSPNINPDVINIAYEFMADGTQELMTVHRDGSIYGSLWAMTKERCENYGDPYHHNPEETLYDFSVDIHTQEDFNKALEQANGE